MKLSLSWKSLSFWVALALTNVGLLLSNGIIGDGTATQVLGWFVTIATALGYKALPVPSEEAPPAA